MKNKELRVGMATKTPDPTLRGFQNKKNTELIISAIHDQNLDIFIGYEWFYWNVPHMTDSEKQKTLDEIMDNVPEETLVVPGTFVWKKQVAEHKYHLYNSAPIIFNKKRLPDYHKYSGKELAVMAREATTSKDLYKAIKGQERGTAFVWGNMLIGLEICSDHTNHCLRSRFGQKLELQIIPAYNNSVFETASAVKEKGHVLLCDGCLGFSNRVYQRKNNKLERVMAEQYKENIDIYRIK